MHFNTPKMKPTRHAVKFQISLLSKNTPWTQCDDDDHHKPYNSAIFIAKHCESTHLTPGILHDLVIPVYIHHFTSSLL